MERGQGPGPAHLAAGRVEGAGQAETPREVVAERRVVYPTAAGEAKPCVELRLRGSANVRWPQLAAADHDRRVHSGVPGHPRSPAPEQFHVIETLGECMLMHGVPE